jgi:hypothetical protein
MDIIRSIKCLIPEFHAFSADDRGYHVGATWTDDQGLRDYHNVELKYTRNSERLALQGKQQPDGSWLFIEPNGRCHVMSAERAGHFMAQAQAQAQILEQMLQNMNTDGGSGVVDTTAISM